MYRPYAVCTTGAHEPFILPPFHSKTSLSIFAGRNHARFRQLMDSRSQSFPVIESLSLSGGMRTLLNKHPTEIIYGKLGCGEFSFLLVDLIASTYGNTSKVYLKIDKLMSLPSIEKESYETVYMTSLGDFVYIGSTSYWKEINSVGTASRTALWQRRYQSKARTLASNFWCPCTYH